MLSFHFQVGFFLHSCSHVASKGRELRLVNAPNLRQPHHLILASVLCFAPLGLSWLDLTAHPPQLLTENRLLIEFKLEGTVEEALQQINEKHCALPFEMDERKLFKIGVNFSAKTRNIEKWVVEIL